jgi:hypothetical protein
MVVLHLWILRWMYDLPGSKTTHTLLIVWRERERVLGNLGQVFPKIRNKKERNIERESTWPAAFSAFMAECSVVYLLEATAPKIAAPKSTVSFSLGRIIGQPAGMVSNQEKKSEVNI